MRLDKYLKVTRIIKRRTLAQELCDGGHVFKNGRTAKPSTQVQVGDIITINYGSRTVSYKVLAVADFADKKTASSLYEEISDPQ
ncbi:MAG: RNA-binding S4 domain-containing protein [Candidatus Fermentithermobacillus carboniphilus]|uniref:RQC P-site tRNA stabilizing factor n=1 Tax=Candidatus Fermentithermobacillus carboniphilus TaxID=3085328 RepID=A0AAT9L9S9_9FIRM|nr:MAG: RNA-binding S4 domain-containing protein [Candidatus Fermentithermobacillus carboniphilus]